MKYTVEFESVIDDGTNMPLDMSRTVSVWANNPYVAVRKAAQKAITSKKSASIYRSGKVSNNLNWSWRFTVIKYLTDDSGKVKDVKLEKLSPVTGEPYTQRRV